MKISQILEFLLMGPSPGHVPLSGLNMVQAEPKKMKQAWF
jgi:hypothetical protein